MYQNVVDGLTWLYSIFDIKLLTVIATCFSIYFGYQKVNKKICVSFSVSDGNLYPAHISNLVLLNKRDNAITIKCINLKIGEKGTLKLVEFNPPLVLKAYDAQLIEVKKYSYIYGRDGEVVIELTDELTFTAIANGGKKIKCLTESSGTVTLEGLKEMITINTSTFNDIVLTDRMSYIFFYRDIDNVSDLKHVIFDRNGFIPDYSLFGVNCFPDFSIEEFRSFLINGGRHDRFSNYSLFKVLDNLRTELVLDKAMVNKFIKEEM